MDETKLGPLPRPDGSAETNKEPHPEGGYIYDEVDAWSEPLVRAYAAEQVAAERERCARLCDAKAESPFVHEDSMHTWIEAADLIRRQP